MLTGYGLNPQVIGETMTHGFAGAYARQPDMIINTMPAGYRYTIPFGTPLKLNNGAVVPMGSGDTGAAFIGIAGMEVKSATDIINQNKGGYIIGDAVAVFQRGCINVKCQRGTPAYGAAVYVRVTANASYPSAEVGGFECDADDGKCVQLTNCAWQGAADTNGIAELRILSLMQQDGTGETYTLPVATSEVLGGVKQGAGVTIAAGGAITVNAATTEAAGVVLKGAAVADAEGTAPTAAEFKALLDSLRAAGVIATNA